MSEKIKTDKKVQKELIVSFVAFALFLYTFVGPIPPSMTRGLFMLVGTVVISSLMWLLIGIGWPNFFILLTLILNPDYGLTKVRQNSFGNSTVFFFICALLSSAACWQAVLPRELLL